MYVQQYLVDELDCMISCCRARFRHSTSGPKAGRGAAETWGRGGGEPAGVLQQRCLLAQQTGVVAQPVSENSRSKRWFETPSSWASARATDTPSGNRPFISDCCFSLCVVCSYSSSRASKNKIHTHHIMDLLLPITGT